MKLHYFDRYAAPDKLLKSVTVVYETLKTYKVTQDESSWKWERRVLKSDMRMGDFTLHETRAQAATALHKHAVRQRDWQKEKYECARGLVQEAAKIVRIELGKEGQNA